MTSDSASVLSVAGLTPDIDESAFLAAGARVIGDVRLGPESSVWYNAVLRGDSASITVGAGSNLQDLEERLVAMLPDLPIVEPAARLDRLCMNPEFGRAGLRLSIEAVGRNPRD